MKHTEVCHRLPRLLRQSGAWPASQLYGLLLLHESCTDDELLPIRTDRDHIAATGTLHRGRKRCISLLLGRRIRKAAEPKELFVVPGATHVDLYDQPEYLKITLPKLDTFFKQYLK